jgi:ABC-type microcin C transport system duplicated ATPase subunit YejF
MDDSLLTISALSLKIGQSPWLVDQLSFSITSGTTTALVGESGSGKSLTARSIIQLLPKNFIRGDQSDIRFKGQSLFAKTETEMTRIRGQEISLISQDALLAFNPVLRIGAQLSEALHIHQPTLTKQQKKKLILAAFDQVGLHDPEAVFKAYVHQCSGGMLQRALIAMALINRPSLLIADEPTTSLDTLIQTQIIELLIDLQKELSMTMLFITHDLALVKKVADHVIVLRQGCCVESQPAATFFTKPSADYSRLLLESAQLPIKANNLADETLPALLTFNQVTFTYPQSKFFWQKNTASPVLSNVSGSVAEGQTLALIGESGSGKTTLARILVGLCPYEDGSITFLGQKLASGLKTRTSHELKNINYVFQNPFASLNPRMTVGQIISEPLWIQQGKSQQQTRSLQCQALAKVALPEAILDQYPQQFSGGQRARIALARALIMQPKLIIFDEPTTALDVSLQKQLLELMQQLQQDYGMTYLIITHDFNVVRFMADQVMVLNQGQVAEYGPVHQVLTSPKHNYTKRLLQAV